jgi:hypothetical protein
LQHPHILLLHVGGLRTTRSERSPSRPAKPACRSTRTASMPAWVAPTTSCSTLSPM